MQRTLSIIKPDGVSKKLIGEVARIFESSGFKIAAMKMKLLSRVEAEGFYYVHKERVFLSGTGGIHDIRPRGHYGPGR